MSLPRKSRVVGACANECACPVADRDRQDAGQFRAAIVLGCGADDADRSRHAINRAGVTAIVVASVRTSAIGGILGTARRQPTGVVDAHDLIWDDAARAERTLDQVLHISAGSVRQITWHRVILFRATSQQKYYTRQSRRFHGRPAHPACALPSTVAEAA